MRDSLEVLRTVFGYPAFRGQQSAIVTHVSNGGSALVLMPTGGGKSLCYQVPALVRDGVTIVVSPLIALMQDQVAALERRGVRAAMLNSTLSRSDSARIESEVRAGTIKLLYLSPERLVTQRTMRLLERSTLALFAIDEAHCISEWGHDFRPEYLQLSLLHQRFPHVPRLALTATADSTTRAEIIDRLGLTEARVFSMSFDRPNITYRIVEKRGGLAQLRSFIERHHAGETGVVYCQSRGKVEETAAFLDANGIPALPYHAGMPTKEREDNQAWFLSHDGLTMVATIAFGMGIDKPDVRFVAHVDVPKSVEWYYQETGRAGRDGLPSEVWLAYSEADTASLYQRIRQSKGSTFERNVQYAKLDAMVALCESIECRRVRVLAYFGEPSAPCGRCDICVAPPKDFDATRAVRHVISAIHRAGRRASPEHVVALLRGDADVMPMRRFYAGIFGAGHARSTSEWHAIIRQCVALGFIWMDPRDGLLRRTNASAAVITGGLTVRMRPLGEHDKASVRKRGRKLAPKDQLLADDLAARLFIWREETAQRSGIPAHMVLHDPMVREIAVRRPAAHFGLARIVGKEKAARYGAELRSTLRSFAASTGE